MFYYEVLNKVVNIIGTMEKKMEKIGNSFVITADDSHIDKIYKIAQVICEMGYDADFVDAEDSAGLRVYVSPDEVSKVLTAIRQC